MVKPTTDLVERETRFGPHYQELFYFGQQLRDRVYLVQAVYFLGKHNPSELPLWNREEKPVTNTDEEESVEEDWHDSFFDARTHPVFKSFQQHLSGCASLDILLRIKERYDKYRTACLEACSDIKNKLKPISKRLTEEGLQLMVNRIYLFCNEHLLSLENTEVVDEEYMEADRVVMPDGTEHYPTIAKMLEDKYTIDFNASLSEVENQLITTLPNDSHFTAVMLAKVDLDESLKEFRRTLKPDSRLRDWILSGKCDLCP